MGRAWQLRPRLKWTRYVTLALSTLPFTHLQRDESPFATA
jgi:hypothetical protein